MKGLCWPCCCSGPRSATALASLCAKMRRRTVSYRARLRPPERLPRANRLRPLRATQMPAVARPWILTIRRCRYFAKHWPASTSRCAPAHFAAAAAAARHRPARAWRIEDARDTFTRALALSPDDPALLAEAADLYISHLAATREHSEIGLLYAERGRRQLQPMSAPELSAAGRGSRQKSRRSFGKSRELSRESRELLAQLWLLTGQARLDLGQASQALPALDSALRLREFPEARYERAVALFELCRFTEAQQAFEDLLAHSPSPRKSAWSHYHLGLVLEQLGKTEAAERELSDCSTAATRSLPAPAGRRCRRV